MKHLASFCILFFISVSVFSQTLEFGPSIQYHRTAFQMPDSGSLVITGDGITEGTKTTETNPNVAFGGYAAYYTENTFAYAVELFYVETSSPNYNDNSFQSINLVPSVAAEFWDTNLFINAGVGVGFILNEPDFADITEIVGEDYRSIDILVKLALNFRIKNVLTLDGGILQGASDVVDNSNRFHFYLGARVPLNLILKKE